MPPKKAAPKPPAKKSPATRAAVKTAPVKKAPVKKAPAKKAPVKKAPAKKAAAKKKAVLAATGPDVVFQLEVALTAGPIEEEFIDANPIIKRTIEILGSQTLFSLHSAIFDAFDREEEHLYEFQLGQGPHDPDGPRYTVPMAMDSDEDGDVTETTLNDLDLEPDRVFGYWFDFGDDWYHQVHVVGVVDREKGVKYPRVTEVVGASPPQYPDYDEDEDEEDEE